MSNGKSVLLFAGSERRKAPKTNIPKGLRHSAQRWRDEGAATLGGESLRARRELAQEALAEKAGVSARYIQNVEAGENFPSLPTLARLRAALRCEWNELVAGCEKV